MKTKYAKPIKFKPFPKAKLHPSLKGINLRLFNRALAEIAKEPSQFDMAWWFANEISTGQIHENGEEITIKPPNCGTAACFGGWVVAVARRLRPKDAARQTINDNPALIAAKYLRLPEVANNMTPVMDRLFVAHLWPVKFANAYAVAQEQGKHRRAAQIALARFTHFLKTGK